jgi:hypothetical protein
LIYTNIMHWAKLWLIKLNPEKKRNSVLQYKALSSWFILLYR